MDDRERVCEHCGSKDLIQDEETGEIICADCGLVVSEVNQIGRSFTDEEPHSSSSKALPPETRSKMNRLMTIDRRLKLDEEDPYVLRLATQEIKRLAQSMHLPENVEENAERIYREAQREKLIPRGTINGFAAASIYAACRKLGLPRTLRHVCEASQEDLKDIARMYRLLLEELDIPVELDDPLKHIPRIAGALGLSPHSERLAIEILEEAMNQGHHVGKSPKGLAASALYIACKQNEEHCSQKALSEAAGVSGLTIRKRVKGLLDNVDLDKLVRAETE
jgi:transcription initiation factor TFIIB